MRILESLPARFALLLLAFPAHCVAQSPLLSPSSGTLRFIAIGRNGSPITDLKPEDLRLHVNGQDRKILSVSSTSSLPKTIGIFIGGSEPGPRANKAIAAIQGFLNSVWRDQDVGFVVSFSDKIYKDVPSTSDLTQIENELPKIFALNLNRLNYYSSHWTTTLPPAWYGAVSSAQLSPKEAGSAEKVYVVLSTFWSYDSAKSEINAVLRQQARIFSLLIVPPNTAAGMGCFYEPNSGGDSSPCYEGLWQDEYTAKHIAKKTGGDEFYLEREKDIIRAQTWLTNELLSTYIVTYEPPPRSAPARSVRVLCKLSGVRLLYARE